MLVLEHDVLWYKPEPTWSLRQIMCTPFLPYINWHGKNTQWNASCIYALYALESTGVNVYDHLRDVKSLTVLSRCEGACYLLPRLHWNGIYTKSYFILVSRRQKSSWLTTYFHCKFWKRILSNQSYMKQLWVVINYMRTFNYLSVWHKAVSCTVFRT